jgi:hemerythrin-like metal-binding protein
VRLAWTDALATGDAEMDRQHREILERAAAVAAAARTEAAAPEAMRALRSLAAYVHAHFDAEERSMVAYGYPGAEEHRRAHEALRAEFRALAEAFRLGGVCGPFVARVTAFITEAIADHVAEHDRLLAAHLATARPRPPAPSRG